ncbi:T-cell surface glycoprotein CD1b isoform X2 [Piliocolobus tephrosceles]|uniref:T-cell surface glycoprotein CD1b isoform X2 n=1 Tax=Piliocolobus tephrosceles TaxID=591936 RepID=UPI000E6AF8F3|nr:T-cell surface glycoprotein CD1b isoform X2 [Piliocolobus tephrosceles]
MLLLPFQLLAFLFPGGDSEQAFQGPTSFHVIQTSSFTNSTWAQTQGSGWLDDLQIHGWDSDSGTAILLKPWSKGNLSDKEFAELNDIFRVYIFGFAQEVQDFAGDFQMKYPFEIQGIAGCELHSGGAIVSFLRGALGGLDFLSVKNASCVPSPEGGSRAQKFCTLIMQYQVKPEAWLSSGPSPGPGRLQLVCHVSGFYPKPVWVMWMQDEQEQRGTQLGDILPNANWTWYLRATLDVAAGEAAGLSCRVKHSSLEGQDIVLYWRNPISTGSIVLAIMVPSLLLLLCLALWYMRRRSYQNIP